MGQRVGYREEVGRYTGRNLGGILGESLAEEGTKEEVGRIGISKMSGGTGYDTGRNLGGMLGISWRGERRK